MRDKDKELLITVTATILAGKIANSSSDFNPSHTDIHDAYGIAENIIGMIKRDTSEK